jgi:glutamyl-tRNA synthetase
MVNEHGLAIARAMDLETSAETFNPVIVDFYEQVGYLPDAIINYLLLLGWSLDDKTEFMSRQMMIENFSLERVTKAPASFDPKKLWAFEDHYMQEMPLKQKVSAMLDYLQRARLVPKPTPCDVGPKLTRIIEAAGDRLKVLGDILTYADFFFQTEVHYDEKAFEKSLRKPGAAELLARFRDRIAAFEVFDVSTLETAMQAFVTDENIKAADIVHAVRVAITGKAVGPGLYDCLEILGKPVVLGRIEQALKRVRSEPPAEVT